MTWRCACQASQPGIVLRDPQVPSVARNLDVWAGFLARVDVLGFDVAAVERVGQMRADLASTGRLIGPNGVSIAGHPGSRGLCPVTNNVSVYERVSGLRLCNWVD